MPVNLDSLNFENLLNDMIGAAGEKFGDGWSQIKNLVEVEFKTLANRTIEIAKAVANGLDEDIAKLQFKAQKNTAIQVIAGATTLTLLTVESAINAVLDVVSNTINTAIGFDLV